MKTLVKDRIDYVINHWIFIHDRRYHVNGITTWPYLPFFKVTFRTFQESAPALSSSILFSGPFSVLLPPKSRTPLPSGDSAIALEYRPQGKDGPVMQKKRIIKISINIKFCYAFWFILVWK